MTADRRPIACVLFSKDRPLQLDAALTSLHRRVGDLDLADVVVLFMASSPRYASLYRLVGLSHPDVRLLRETDFKPDLLGLLAAHSHAMFVVDDTVFVGDASLAAAKALLDGDPSCLGFSFRLGRNTTYCYSLDADQRLPAFQLASDGLLEFDWPGADHDFGYPLELSSSLYRTHDLLPLLDQLPFTNPNTLEAAIAREANRFRLERPRLACCGQSVAVSVPANLVQTAWSNRVDGRPELSVAALADRFAQGWRVDVDRYRGHVSRAAHEELDLPLAREPDLPIVSIVIPCYNQAEFLPETVESVVAQTLTDWELLIVDDGSPDETARVAAELASRHPTRQIRTLRQANAGLAEARNAGIRVARGAYILPLDADDLLAPTMLERAVSVLEERPDLSIAYTDVRWFGDQERLVRAAEFDPLMLPNANQLSYCSLYRREVWEAVGGYNPNLVYGYEDWDFWLGALERGYLAERIPEPLFEYRVRPGSMYSGALARDTELRRRIRLNHPGLYRLDRRIRRWGVWNIRRIRSLVGTARAVRKRGLRSSRSLK